MRFFVEDLFTQTKDTDPDLRFMALNDLEKEIIASPDSFSSEARVHYAKILLHCLDDEFAEVRTQALKCFETLTPRLGGYVTNVVTALGRKKPEKISITSTIYTMALHNVFKNFVANESVARDVANTVLSDVFDAGQEAFYTRIDYIEILTDLVEHLGIYLTSAQLNNLGELLSKACYEADIVIAKKSVFACGLVARNFTSVEQMNKLLSQTNRFSTLKEQNTTLNIVTNLVRSNTKLMSSLVGSIYPLVLKALYLDSLAQPDDDFDAQQELEETRAEALGCLIAMFESLQIEEYVNESLELASRFINYNPYKDDDEEEMDEEDDYELSDLDDEDDDDGSGVSWKLRREAARLVSVIPEHHPLSLPALLRIDLDPLTIQLGDDNTTVVTETLRTLTKIFRYSVTEGPYYTLKFFNSLNDFASGRRGSDVSMQNDDDPTIMLTNRESTILDAFSKLLVPQNSTKLSLLYDFFVEYSNATDGCDPQYTSSIVSKLLDLRESSLTSEVVKFYAALLKKYTFVDLGASSDRLVADIVQCVSSSSNHELVLESMNLLIEMLENESGAQFPAVEDALIDKASNKNYSTEIRQKALICLRALVTKSDPTDLNKALDVFAHTITIEFLVSVTLQCVSSIVQQIPDRVPIQWLEKLVARLVEHFTIPELQTQSLKTLDSISLLLDETNARIVYQKLVSASEAGKIVPDNAVLVCDIFNKTLSKIVVSDVDVTIRLLVQFSKAASFDSDALSQLTNTILRQKDASDFISVVSSLASQSEPNVSKILGIVSVQDESSANLDQVLENLKHGKQVLFSISFIEQYSKSFKLDISLEPLFEQLGGEEEIKNAAVHAIATVVTGNPDRYLSELVQELEESITVPLLQVLKLVLQKIQPDLASSRHQFDLLVNSQIEKADAIETAAEIVSFLAVRNLFLEDICTILSSGPTHTQRLLLGTTVKYTFVDPALDADLVELSKYLELTSTDDFIFGSSLELKQLGLNNLIFALHKKPLVALPLCSRIMPQVLDTELEQKKEYVEIVRIGPFKHKLDNGLNFRKGVYELVYSLLTTLESNPKLLVISHIDWNLVFERFIARAFKDDPTVIFICLLTLVKIINLKPSIFAGSQTLDNFIAASTKVLDKKLKEDAPKQDIEKRNDTIKAVLRCCKKINNMVESGQVKLEGYTSWANFINTLRTKYPIFEVEE